MAERIREQGLRPGLWLRPFHAAQRGALAPAPDLRSCLDVSAPSALDRIRSLISTVVHQWGYTYLKLDFMTHDFFGCWGMELDSPRPAAFTTSDDTQTNIQIYRRGLEAVREAAGDEVIINACNCLVGPAIGIADVFRIGDDIDADNWDRTFTMGARSVQPMAFLNRTVFLNDPDCVFFHGPLSSEEQRTWMLFVRITGGLRTLGSPATSSVGVTGFFALHDTMQSNLFQSIDHWNNPPSLWRNTNTPFDASDTLVIFNWSRHDRNMRIPLAVLNAGSGPCHVFEWYGSQYLGALRDDFDIAVPAHAVRVLRVRRDSGTPALITLDVDLLADEEGILYESWHAPGTLRIARQLEHPTRAWFVVPEGLSPLLEHGTFTFDGSILMLTLPAGDGIIDIMFKTGHDDTPA
jgi:alpha-galactosidase